MSAMRKSGRQELGRRESGSGDLVNALNEEWHQLVSGHHELIQLGRT